MTEPATQTVTAEPAQPPPAIESATLAPPEIDPYFVKKDGTKVTGEPSGDKANGKSATRDQAGKFAKAITDTAVEAEKPEAKTEPAPAPAEAEEPAAEAKSETEATEKPAEEERAQRIGDAWREVKAQKKEMQRAQAELAQRERQIAAAQAAAKAEQDAAKADREAVQAELAEAKRDLRGFLKKHNLSFRELVEADLNAEEQAKAADPKERELAEAKEAAAKALAAIEELKAERAAEREAAERAEQERIAAQERQTEIGQISEFIATNAAEYPYLAHYKRAAIDLRDAYDANGGNVNILALIDAAEQHLAKQDEELAPARTGKQVAEVPATAARAESRNGSRVAEVPEEKPVANSRQAQPSTLTNRTAAQRQSAAVNTAKMSPEERARVIAARTLKWRSE